MIAAKSILYAVNLYQFKNLIIFNEKNHKTTNHAWFVSNNNRFDILFNFKCYEGGTEVV
jgi:hypothetical protein